MNTKTGKEIGHPSGHYSWDIVGVVEHCFPDCGIESTLYIGPGYATRARSTAAQSERELPENVMLLPDFSLDPSLELQSSNLIYPDQNGVWHHTSSLSSIDVDWSVFPFGPILIEIHGFTYKSGFPASTLQYLINTLERGEEPMEIRGRNNYSTVSGWKAFARWMQSYAIPLPDVQHQQLNYQANLLVERRFHFIEFLMELLPDLNEKETELIAGLQSKYEQAFITLIEEMTENSIDSFDRFDWETLVIKKSFTLGNIRSCYFAEQKTLTYYKKLSTYLTHFYE